MADSKTKKKSYKYLDCCIYRVEHLIARGALSKEKLPLFAALLGNDYIARSAFKNFFAVGLGKSGRSRKMKQQQRRIKVIQQWLKNETAQSALSKILNRLKLDQRESLQAQVNAAISGYSNERCVSYDFFETNHTEALNRYPPQDEDEIDDLEDEDFEDIEDDVAEDEEEIEEDNEQDVDVDKQPDETGSAAEVGDFDENEIDQSGDESKDDVNEEVSDEPVEFKEDENPYSSFPSWFLDKFYPGNLPRFFVDLMYLRKYINSPQIEHFPYEESNEIALPILVYIFSLINGVDGEERNHQVSEDGTPLPIEFTYLTRRVRVTNILYKRIAALPESVKYPFIPQSPNHMLIRQIFENTPKLDATLIFQKLDVIPSNLRLYVLAIIYWLHASQYCDLLHLHALLICLVVLQTVDSKIPAERDLRAFQKRFGKIIRTERQVRDKEFAQGVKRNTKSEIQALSIPERMEFIPKSDCYLVQNNLLKHFHMQEIFKKKYDVYSTTVLHGFAEFQSVVFQLHALNALLDSPYDSPRMGQLYCGVFIYNLYDLLKSRTDVRYFVENFLLQDSKMMFDYYCFLYDWCDEFIPIWKRPKEISLAAAVIVNKKVLKKQRQTARKKAALLNARILLEPPLNVQGDNAEEDSEFFDLNNKFCNLLKVS